MSRYLPEAHRAMRDQQGIFAAIERVAVALKASDAGWAAVPDHPVEPPWSDEVDLAQERAEALCDAWGEAFDAVLSARPSTLAGFRALARYLITDANACGSTRDALPHLRSLIGAAEQLLTARAA